MKMKVNFIRRWVLLFVNKFVAHLQDSSYLRDAKVPILYSQ